MSQVHYSIAEWQRRVHEQARRKGWYEEPVKTFGEFIVMIHKELSTAIEHFRREGLRSWYNPSKAVEGAPRGAPEGVAHDMADVVIRVLDLCEHYGIDLEAAMIEKHEYNAKRPHRHGGLPL